MAKQMKKYIAVTTASFMAMQLAACGNTETQTVKESTATTDNTTEKNNTTTAGNGVQSVYDSDMANACDEWKESDDGSFECLDENSPNYAHHFFNGLMYATTGAMIGSAIYKSRNLRNGTDREDKGGGSAVPRTTHSNTRESKNTNSNGITTNGSQNPAGTTSSSSNNTTNSSNSNTGGSKSYSSGKRSFSNSSGSSTNSSNSYSNHSSSSTGKSGFGSGGASRGGSSSS